MRWVAWFIGICLAGIAVVLGLGWAMGGFAGMDVDLNIAIAIGLGIVFTSALAVGLMALVFYSSRSGRDEEANRPLDRWDDP